MTRKKKIRIVLLIVIPIVLIGMFLLEQYVVGDSNKPIEGPDQEAKARSAAAGGSSAGRSGGRAIPVEVYVTRIEEISEEVSGAAGALLPNEEVEISSEVAGKVTEVLFKEGTRVKKGDVLVKINDDDLQAQLKRYHFQEATMKENVERQRILYEREAISQQAYDEIMTQYNMLLADMELLNVRIERTHIRAPFSGTIGLRSVSEGSYIQPGTKIARLVDLNTLKVEFAIPQRYTGLRLIGRQVHFITDESNQVRSARVYAIEPKLDELTRSIIVRALYNNAGGTLRPGMSAWVTIPVTEAEKMIMVPSQAIVQSISGMNVWVVKDGRPELTPVEAGLRNASSVQITQGLMPGDSVIVTGLMQLREGSTIRITN